MRADPLTLSIETVIAASRMLGHPLEDRSRVRAGQQPELVEAFRQAGTVPLRNPEQRGPKKFGDKPHRVGDLSPTRIMHLRTCFHELTPYAGTNRIRW